MRKWLTDIADLIGARVFGAKPPEDPQPELNRKQRRDLARQKPGERRMRLERTFIAQAKRKKRAGVRGGDHGAKSKRAFAYGIRKGTAYLELRLLQAYQLGIAEGRRQRSPLRRFLSRFRASAAAPAPAAPTVTQ